MVQHYAALRTTTQNDDRLHFWVANPGSLLWLTEDRPVQAQSCEDVDAYKYGLDGGFPGYATADARQLGREGLVRRYQSRNLHYAWGMKDNGPGDTRCEAMTQGSTHLERGQNFVRMLEGMEGGVPARSTVDWIPNVAHWNEGMMNSDGGVDKLFVVHYNGTS